MWTLLIFLNLWTLLCTVSTSPPSPTNVRFSSVNLRSMLQWLPGNGTQDDTYFTVQYAIYGERILGTRGKRVNWRAVRQCTEIARSWCDLSSEMQDLEQGYFARVRAVHKRAFSQWVLTKRFDPKSDTSFGPPLVSVEIENNSAIITLKGPMRYQPHNHTPAASMASVYPHMRYNLSIHDSHSGHTNHFQVGSRPFKYGLMEYDTEYCFSAKAHFLSMPVQCQSSAQHCITTAPDPVIAQLKWVVVGIIVPSVVICMLVVAGYLLHYYLSGKGQKSPYMLNKPSFSPAPLMFPPEAPKIILISVINSSDIETAEPACPKGQRCIANSSREYAPQRSETPPALEEPWDDVSIDYGFVAVAQKINGGGEEEQQRERGHDGGGDWNNLNGERQKWVATGSYEKKQCCRERVYASQTKSSHMPMQTLTEMSTPVQARAWSQVNSVLLTQTQVPLLSFQGEVDRGKEDRESPGLFISKNPQNGIFHIPLKLQASKEGGMGQEMDGKEGARAGGKIDGGEEESEKAPLLSAYASQNIKDMSTSHTGQSDCLPDYGVLRLARADEIEIYDDDEEEEEKEEEEGPICIEWDLKTRKLVLPKLAMEVNTDGLMQGEKGKECRIVGEDKEEVNEMKSELTLDNVYVRQSSEEEAEAQRLMERGEERGWEADDVLTKWNLVISMDE